MIPGGAARLELHIGHGQAAGFEDGDGIGLGVEDIDGLAAALRRIRPEAAGTGEGRGAAADAARHTALAGGQVALIGAGDLEERDVAIALVALRCAAVKRPGSSEGRMSDMSAAIGFASASCGDPPPNSSASAFGMKDQVTASSMPREAKARLAARVRICSVVRMRPLTEPLAGRARP